MLNVAFLGKKVAVNEYCLKDHLGNNRITFTDKNNDGIIQFDDNNDIINEILSEKHYYSFGMEMKGPWYTSPSPAKYTYNGKEFNDDFGLNWSDYGARNYDAAVGRWWSVDPLAEDYVDWSPYNYTMNNPIKYIDPDGMSVETIIVGGQEWKDGATYKGSDDFGKRVFDALNNIANTSQSGKEWLDELSNSKFDFEIKQDNIGRSRFDPDNKPTYTNGKANLPTPRGGTTYINEATPSKINTEKGIHSDLETTISHELLGHGIDYNRGITAKYAE